MFKFLSTFAVLLTVATCISSSQSRFFPFPKKPAIVAALTQQQNETTHIETVNQLADVIVEVTRPIMLKYRMNPFKLPNMTQPVFPVNLHLNNLEVYNLTTIQRYKNVEIINNRKTKNMTIHVQLTFDDIQVHADYVAGVVPVNIPTFKGHVAAKVPSVLVDLTIVIDFDNVVFELTQFRITIDEKIIHVKFTGSIESHFINILATPIASIFKNLITEIIGGPIKDQVNQVLREIYIAIHSLLENLG